MMKKILFLVVLLFPLAAHAQYAAWNGSCDQEAVSALTSGLPSSNKMQGIIPYCTVTVYLTGTLTKATIFKDAVGTTLTNPYQAPVTGKVLFYAAQNTGYDIVGSAGFPPNAYPSPFTICTDCLTGGGTGGTGVTNFAAGSLPPLFTTNVVNPTSNPLLTFVLTNQNSFTFYGNFTSGIGPPSFWTLQAGPNATITANTILGTVTINSLACVPVGLAGVVQASNGMGACQAVYTQVNGVTLSTPTLPNFVDSPSVHFTNPGTNQISATAISNIQGALQQLVQTPTTSYQTYVMYPTVGTANQITCSAFATPTSGAIGSCGTGSSANIVWSGFSLPGSILQSSIHAIIPFFVGQGFDGSIAPAYPQNTQACTGGSGSFFVTPGNVFNLGTYYQGTVASPTTFDFSTATCTANTLNSLPLQQSGGGQYISGIGYIIQYTGTPIPNNDLQIVPPLQYNIALNSLSLPLPYDFAIDTNTSTHNAFQVQIPAILGPQPGLEIKFLPYYPNTSTTPTLTLTDGYYNTYTGTIIKQNGGALSVNDINPVEIPYINTGIADVIWDGGFWELQNPQTGGGSGGGGLSGQTVNYLPLATSATASTISSALQDTGSQLIYHGTGAPHGLTIPASASPVTPVAGSAIYTSDNSGNGDLSENGGTAARLCTATNGVCSSGGNQPADINYPLIGTQTSSNQVLGYFVNALSTSITIPSSCTGSYGIAQNAATGSIAFTVKDITTATTLCTFTWAGSGTTAVVTGSGGTISAGDVVEALGGAVADGTLGNLAVGVYGTR